MYFFIIRFALLRLISRCSIRLRLRLASPDTERHNRGAEHDAQGKAIAGVERE
jgi:hypothetical protein